MTDAERVRLVTDELQPYEATAYRAMLDGRYPIGRVSRFVHDGISTWRFGNDTGGGGETRTRAAAVECLLDMCGMV